MSEEGPINVSNLQSEKTIYKWKCPESRLIMSKTVHEAYKKDMKAGLLIHRITARELNEIDLDQNGGKNLQMDEAKSEFQKEKAKAFVTLDGRTIGTDKQRVPGDIFKFMNELIHHEIKRTDDRMTKEILKQKEEQIKDESVKEEWQAVVAASNPATLAAKGMDDLTKFRKNKEKSRPATAPIRRGPNDPAAEFQIWPANEWSVPRGLSAHRLHSAKVKGALQGKQKAAALVSGLPAFEEFEFQPPADRKWAEPIKLEFTQQQQKLIVGRGEACDIRIQKCHCSQEGVKAISREHCTITIDDLGILTIQDHSGNGTLVNDLLLKLGDGKRSYDNQGQLKKQHPVTSALNIGDSVTFGGEVSDCKYVLALKKQRSTLSKIDAAKLDSAKENDTLTDAVKQARILAGDSKLAAVEVHRAWALWSNLDSVVKDMSSVRRLVSFATAGSPYQCAHAAAALHALSRDTIGLNHLLNAGGVAALSTLAAVDDFVDGLEVCKEEALLGLRSVIMSSAQGRERVARDGALRVLRKIAGNSDDEMCYIAEEAVREFEDAEDLERQRAQEKAVAMGKKSRPQTATSFASQASDTVSNAETDVYTIASSRANGAREKGDRDIFVGAKMDLERKDAFRPQSAIVQQNLYSRPGSAISITMQQSFELSGDGSLSREYDREGTEPKAEIYRSGPRPASAAMILTQRECFQEASKRPHMFKKEYLSSSDNRTTSERMKRGDSAFRPGSVNSQQHKKKRFFAKETTVLDVGRQQERIDALESELLKDKDKRNHKDTYMPSCPRGPLTGSSVMQYSQLKEALLHGQEFKNDGIYRLHYETGVLPRDIDDLPASAVAEAGQNLMQRIYPESSQSCTRDDFNGGPASSSPLNHPDDQGCENRLQTSTPPPLPPCTPSQVLCSKSLPPEEERRLLEKYVTEEDFHADDLQIADNDRGPEAVKRAGVGAVSEHVSKFRRSIRQRPGSALPTKRLDTLESPIPPVPARPASAGGILKTAVPEVDASPSVDKLRQRSIQFGMDKQCTVDEGPQENAALGQSSQLPNDGIELSPEIQNVAILSAVNRKHYQTNVFRPSTPGGLMPIFERSEQNMNDSGETTELSPCAKDASMGHDHVEDKWPVTADEDEIDYFQDSLLSSIMPSIAPLWGQIVDDLFALSLIVGRVFSEDQVINLVQNVCGKIISLDRSHHEVADQDNLFTMKQSGDLLHDLRIYLKQRFKGSGMDYLNFAELLAPDSLSRHALELFCVLKDKTAEGVCMEELNRALALAGVSGDVISHIMARTENSVRIRDRPEDRRVKFSELHDALNDLAMVGSEGNEDSEDRQGRMQKSAQCCQLERKVEQACDALRTADYSTHLRNPKASGHGNRDNFGGSVDAKSVESEREDKIENCGLMEERRVYPEDHEADVYLDEDEDAHSPRDGQSNMLWDQHTNNDSKMTTRARLQSPLRPQSAASYRSQIANSLPSTSACHQQSFQDVDVFTRNGLTPGFRPQNASLCSPISSRSGKSLDSRHSTPLTSPLSHTNLYSETEQQQVETVQPAGSNGTQFTETKVDVLYESIVNRRPRAQSAQSLRSQSARNRLLSRGLPMSPSRLSSSTTNPTSAAASAAATVPNSGLTTASHSGAPSGVHTPQKVLHDDNRNQHEEAEEELRYKQALMRALEKSYLDEVSKIQREIHALSARQQGSPVRPATASAVYPHLSTRTIGLARENQMVSQTSGEIRAGQDCVTQVGTGEEKKRPSTAGAEFSEVAKDLTPEGVASGPEVVDLGRTGVMGQRKVQVYRLQRARPATALGFAGSSSSRMSIIEEGDGRSDDHLLSRGAAREPDERWRASPLYSRAGPSQLRVRPVTAVGMSTNTLAPPAQDVVPHRDPGGRGERASGGEGAALQARSWRSSPLYQRPTTKAEPKIRD